MILELQLLNVRTSSHNLSINMAKWCNLLMTRKFVEIAWEIVENEMQVLFDCDNCNTLRQDIFKKIKVIDNIELDTSNKLQKLEILL